MNIRLYKDELVFMGLSMLALGFAVCIEHEAFEWRQCLENLMIILNFIAGEIPHSYQKIFCYAYYKTVDTGLLNC